MMVEAIDALRDDLAPMILEKDTPVTWPLIMTTRAPIGSEAFRNARRRPVLDTGTPGGIMKLPPTREGGECGGHVDSAAGIVNDHDGV